jgi:hypothetical protein
MDAKRIRGSGELCVLWLVGLEIFNTYRFHFFLLLGQWTADSEKSQK